MRFLLILVLVLVSLCGDRVLAKSPKSISPPVSAEKSAGGVDNDPAARAEPNTPADSAESSESQSQDQSAKNAGDPQAIRKVNNLANLEALLNIIANGLEILGIVFGAPTCLLVPVGLVLVWMNGKRLIGAAMIIVGPTIVILGVATPGIINWLVASARDAGMFN